MAEKVTGKTLPLNHKTTSRALALLSGISFCAIGAQPAKALTLMEMLSGKRQPSIQEQVEGARPQAVQPPVSQRQIDMSDPEPLPKVSAPKYLTYKPDALRPVKTAGFAAATGMDGTRFLAQAKVSAPSDVANAIEAYYAKNAAPLWVENGDVSERARAVLALFDRAQEYGLDPADYTLKAPSLTTSSVSDTPAATPVSTAAQTPAASPADQHDRDLMQFELALSAKVVLFAQDMVRGRIDANRISEYHDIKRKSVQLDAILPALKAAPDVTAYLDGMAPQSPEFKALQAEMKRVRAEATTAAAPVTLPENLSIKPGGSSPQLANLVAAIGQRGSDALKAQHAALMVSYQNTPTYTPEVVELVKAFQKEAGLKPDGVVGRSTVRAITGHSDGDKVSKLIVAMEQARWLPNDLGQRYVFINQPAFRVYYHEHGQEQFSMRVVVGSPSHQTFFFQDEIETVEFNPYWGVPQSIIVNEMLPKLRHDPSYLDRLGYQVEVSGRAVSSTQVDWGASTQNVSVRQPPSSDNALGDLKILFPNAHAIYMHDTPQKSFFQRDMRALRHGCVRLAEPRKMAAAVLGITEKDVADRIAQKKNVAAPVPQKFPVYVSYFTAWPNKDGKVEYFDDVYSRDAAVMKAFAATTKARAI